MKKLFMLNILKIRNSMGKLILPMVLHLCYSQIYQPKRLLCEFYGSDEQTGTKEQPVSLNADNWPDKNNYCIDEIYLDPCNYHGQGGHQQRSYNKRR